MAGTSDRTQQLWEKVKVLMQVERENGILEADNQLPTGIAAHKRLDTLLKISNKLSACKTDKPLEAGNYALRRDSSREESPWRPMAISLIPAP